MGRDFIYGLGGNDTVCGGLGSDLIDGGTGVDIRTPARTSAPTRPAACSVAAWAMTTCSATTRVGPLGRRPRR
ncbi:hypothetical protein [Nocardioides silvaticus]|uniref:hypothetical protein n=1 Tax=Nocardioides silvaticus TaxID=2201891 RepID=UPI001B8757FC